MDAGARDLLRQFSGGFSTEEVTGEEHDGIELGLSLGGCFNSRDAENSRLMRSSSIPAMLQSNYPTVVPIVRSCSLPSEADEEIRRRKEMQSIKRMEAKRKREERMNLKRFDEDVEGGSVGKMRMFEVEENGVIEPSSRRFGVASQGSSSSGGSELESRPGQGFEFPGIICSSDSATPSIPPATSKHNDHKSPAAPTPSTTPASKSIDSAAVRRGIAFNENFPKKNERERSLNGTASDACKNTKEATGNEKMPFVSTRGEGPNGRRIEGFLYRYGKGEVSIVCVCHGSFLTPAEFVKHAGGGDVAHPLRHIVVNPSPGFLL